MTPLQRLQWSPRAGGQRRTKQRGSGSLVRGSRGEAKSVRERESMFPGRIAQAVKGHMLTAAGCSFRNHQNTKHTGGQEIEKAEDPPSPA